MNATALFGNVAIFACAIAAIPGPLEERMGWWTVAFVAGGAAIGFAAAIGIHALAPYRTRKWARYKRLCPAWTLDVLDYLFVPIALACCAATATCLLANLLAHWIA